MLIVTVMLAVIFGLVLHFTSRNLEEQSKLFLQGVREAPGMHGPAVREERFAHFAVTIDPQGRLSVNRDTFWEGSEDQILEIARSIYESGEQQGHLKEQDLRFKRRIGPFGEEIIFVDTSMEQSVMEGLLRTCISISIISYILFFLISVLLANWAVRPVETAWKNQRQFVADASHELKTPLTVIMTNAELLQDDGYETEEKRKFGDNILAMSQQMRGLVEGLLDLSRIDSGIVKTCFTELDFSGLVSDSLLPFEPLFFEKGMELNADVDQGIIVQGSQSHLRQVVDILLDNAWKYAQPPQPVQVRVIRHGRYVQLSVETAGEAIEEQDLKNIFKRFYRVDKVRAMNHSYGLGLSIAESIVQDHRGKIWAESKNGRNTFFVLLPAGGHCKA